MTDDLLRQAITSIKSGDIAKGKQLLIQVIEQNSANEYAWLWLSKCVTSNEQKIDCMKRVLEINPNNADAQRELPRLQTLLQIKAQPVQSTQSQIKPQPVPSPSPSKKTKSPNLSSYILVGALVIICVFCFVGTSLLAARDSANTRNESVSVTTIEVYIMTKSFVENQLKAPATAKWPAFDEIIVQKFPDPPNTYRVLGFVDSENGFGALIRTNYTCDLTYKGGDWANPQNWEVINIVFDQ